MFTGLVEGLGTVGRLTPQGPDAMLVIAPPWEPNETVLGESITVSGACLTVTKVSAQGFSVDVSAETLSRTTLGRLGPGSRVNLERALKLGERLGGHLVTGHVDCVGTLLRIQPQGASYALEVGIPAEHLRYVVEKGSVCLEGISLTVNQVAADRFAVNIIPHTWQATTLHLAKQGDSVNIETDLIGKYVARLLNRDEEAPGERGSLTSEELRRMGY